MSDKETEKFIDAFEQKDCLWRTTSPEYSDRNVRLKAASEIGAKMNMMGQYFPTDFGIGVAIPLPKGDSLDSCNMDNRAVSISQCSLKLWRIAFWHVFTHTLLRPNFIVVLKPKLVVKAK